MSAWGLFILSKYRTFQRIDDDCFLFQRSGHNYILSFHYSWLWEIYEVSSHEEIKSKLNIAGMSNKSNYISFFNKKIGHKIEKIYYEYLSKCPISKVPEDNSDYRIALRELNTMFPLAEM